MKPPEIPQGQYSFVWWSRQEPIMTPLIKTNQNLNNFSRTPFNQPQEWMYGYKSRLAWEGTDSSWWKLTYVVRTKVLAKSPQTWWML